MKIKTINWKQHATLGVSAKYRNDYADYDYLDKLNESDLMWLRAFHREYINSDFKHKYKKLYKGKKQKKVIYGLNNCRQRCVYNRKKWRNELFLVASIKEHTKYVDPFWYTWFK
jgi:hypothetical protein